MLERLVRIGSSWCQCLELGCLQGTLCWGLVFKYVLLTQRLWWQHSSSRRWPISFIFPMPKWAISFDQHQLWFWSHREWTAALSQGFPWWWMPVRHRICPSLLLGWQSRRIGTDQSDWTHGCVKLRWQNSFASICTWSDGSQKGIPDLKTNATFSVLFGDFHCQKKVKFFSLKDHESGSLVSQSGRKIPFAVCLQ